MDVDALEFTSTINVASKNHDDQQNDDTQTLELFC